MGKLNLGQTLLQMTTLNRTKSFGGFSFIFAGDFRQLEPICSKESELLFSSKSTQHWDQNINAIINLENEQYFKEDPKYSKMLKRMWKGDLTLEDKQRINTRVIGINGLELPSMLQSKYKIILVQNNMSFLTLTCIYMSVISITRRHLLCMSDK
jgi:hypothetical protein